MSNYNNLNFSLSMKTNKYNKRTDDFSRQTEHFLLVYCCGVARRRRYRIIDVGPVGGAESPWGAGASLCGVCMLS